MDGIKIGLKQTITKLLKMSTISDVWVTFFIEYR